MFAILAKSATQNKNPGNHAACMAASVRIHVDV
jgi:hypothetical protein